MGRILSERSFLEVNLSSRIDLGSFQIDAFTPKAEVTSSNLVGRARLQSLSGRYSGPLTVAEAPRKQATGGNRTVCRMSFGASLMKPGTRLGQSHGRSIGMRPVSFGFWNRRG